MNRRLVYLLGVAGVLGVLVVTDPFGGRDGAAPAISRSGPGQNADGDSTRPAAAIEESGAFLDSLNRYRVTEQRPLFSPERRPPQREARPGPDRRPEPVAQPARAPDFLVTGVAAGPEGRGAALIQFRGETQRLQVGDRLDGWTLDAVEANAVVVRRDDQTWRLPVGPRDDG